MSTPITIATGYQAAVAALHTAEVVLQDARQTGDTAATWNAEKNLLAAEDHANVERVAVLTAHAKQALVDLENSVGHKALTAHAIYTSAGLFQGSLADFLRYISPRMNDEAKVAAAAASLPASPLRHGSPLLDDDRRAAIRDAMQRQAA